MPNQKIFCNAPWFELQIYWDGSLGFCCHESHQIYPDESKSVYNVRNMSIKDWYNSEPLREIRKSIMGDQPLSVCSRCYNEEKHGSTSRRHKANQKSVIFTRSAFDASYQQSPNIDKFENSYINNGAYDGMPIDLHIDLGNYCNLSCKMCRPQASSLIATQYVKWGMQDAAQYIGTDWTRDRTVWEKVLCELGEMPNLKNIHFMGGETLITKRFEDLVDYMIGCGRTDIGFSFVTNGTIFNETLMNKLKQFRRVGIEVSIEALDARNSYQRQGTDQAVVMQNLQKYLGYCDNNQITLTVRPAISALTIGSYHELLEFCFNNKIIVKNLLVTRPAYLDVRILPDQIKQQYAQSYHQLQQRLGIDTINAANRDFNESDPNQIASVIKMQIDCCINLLNTPALPDQEQQLEVMVKWCRKWDDVYGYDATAIYPELGEWFKKYGY